MAKFLLLIMTFVLFSSCIFDVLEYEVVDEEEEKQQVIHEKNNGIVEYSDWPDEKKTRRQEQQVEDDSIETFMPKDEVDALNETLHPKAPLPGP